jgi:ADP-ribose pyrophosphatase YjhB (NUDIX family)
VEYGDSAEETVLREAEEEVGLRVRAGELFGVYFGTDDPRNVAHLIVYRVEAEGEPIAGDDVDAVGFFGPRELPANLAFEAQRAAIRDWVARQSGKRAEGPS